MSRKCEICGKKPMFGHNVSHSNNKTQKIQNPNVQKVRVKTENGSSKRQLSAQDVSVQEKFKKLCDFLKKFLKIFEIIRSQLRADLRLSIPSAMLSILVAYEKRIYPGIPKLSPGTAATWASSRR
jgi:large subunit ribosomal protein L28